MLVTIFGLDAAVVELLVFIFAEFEPIDDGDSLLESVISNEENTFHDSTLQGEEANANLPSLSAEARAGAVRAIRLLLAHYDALEELQAALTLFDALCSRWTGLWEAAEGGSRPFPTGGLLEPGTLAAVVRLALKGGGRAAEDCCMFRLVEERVGMTPERLEGEYTDEDAELDPITVTELAIMKALNFRVSLPSLPSPDDWVCIILRQIEARRRGAGAGEDPELAKVANSVSKWAELLTERIGMTAKVPPRSLALGACVLGAVTTGAMPADEARPLGVPPPLWEASLLARHCPGGSHGTSGPWLLSAADLARAAGWDTEELRMQAFNVARALQETVG